MAKLYFNVSAILLTTSIFCLFSLTFTIFVTWSILAPAAYGQITPPIEDLLPDSITSASNQIESLYNSRIGASQTSLQIMNTTREQCEADNFIGISCMSLIYESPNTVVVDGDMLLLELGSISEGGKYWPNPYIWRAVDQFKAQGYTLMSAELAGQGSSGNPHDWIIVMTK